MPPKCPKCQTYHSQQKPCPADPAQSAPSAEEWLKTLPHCKGYPACDGDLLGIPHEKDCQMFGKQFPSITELMEAYAAIRTAQLERELEEYKRGAFSLGVKLGKVTARAETAESALARQKQLTVEDIEEMAGYIADTKNDLGSKVLKVAAYLVGMKIRVAAQTQEEK